MGDVNGDGVPDLLQTSNRTISLLVSTEMPTSATGVVYVESALAWDLFVIPGTGSPRGQDWGWGAELADVDNDGDQDAIATFGAWDHYLGNPNEYDEIWLLDGQTFAPTAEAWGVDWPQSTRGLAVFDVDGNGTVDLLRRALDGGLRIDRARCGPEGWLSVALNDTRTPNGYGIGATLTVSDAGQTWTEWIGSGSSGMFTGGPPVAHFGLGDRDRVEELCVTWPDGEKQCHADVEVRQHLLVQR